MELTEVEKNLISQIASDIESGNHLIRKRDENYWAMYRYITNIIKDVKFDIIMSHNQQIYYDYFKSCNHE